ncbi:MAG: hypothetical protein GX129_01060 [Clostridiales bacterium]|nr:hypothetical protein [Clostridiales bacterium]
MFIEEKNIQKILPIKNPINTTWTWNASLDAILRNYPITDDWIYCNYVQLYCNLDPDIEGKLFVDFQLVSGGFHDCPWIINQVLSRNFIDEFICDITDFFIKSINKGYYIFVIVDENTFFHISKSKLYHELFIYGYNLKTKMFSVSDFTHHRSSNHRE